jgi:hypothetical protein
MLITAMFFKNLGSNEIEITADEGRCWGSVVLVIGLG